MNTTSSIRSIVAAAAAGALVLGSAAAATASPGRPDHARHGKGHAAHLQLTTVDIHRHSPININAAATARNLKVRATVRDTARAQGADPVSVTVVLAQYSRKRGTEVEPPAFADLTRTLDLKRTKKNAKTYTGVVTGTELRTALGTLPVGGTAVICIKSAELVGAPGATVRTDSRHVTMKENGGDCVRVVNVAPEQTRTRSDDPRSTN